MIEYSFAAEELEYFLLILCRVLSFIYIAPFFGMNNTPGRVKIGLGVFISFLLYKVITPHVYPEYSSVLGYAVIVMKETATGVLIGYSTHICTTITSFAGRIIDMEIGLSMVNQLDPTTKENATISGVFYQYLVMLIMLVSGMYQFLLLAFVDTFTLIPINGAIFHSDKLLVAIITFLTDYIVIGFRICLPVFSVMLILNVILGILAKVAPQLNMFAVGIQLKVLAGLTTMFVTIGMLPGASNFIFTEMKRMMVSFVEGMM